MESEQGERKNSVNLFKSYLCGAQRISCRLITVFSRSFLYQIAFIVVADLEILVPFSVWHKRKGYSRYCLDTAKIEKECFL